MQLTVRHLNELPAAAKEILSFAASEKILVFYGEMGAGKTTLIKEICKVLGVKGNTSSPTFSIVNEYQAGSELIYHFDFYRLKRETEALDFGYEDYFYSGHYCFIEWPEKIPHLLPLQFIKIEITSLSGDERTINMERVNEYKPQVQ